MPENKTVSCTSTGGDQTKKDNAASQALVPFVAPKEAVEIFQENKLTNTEGVNKGIYFSYPCRRHSCSLVNVPAPCVNKIISHIENVESKIQEHLKQFETSFEEWSRASAKHLEVDWSLAAPVKEVKPKEERDEKCPELKQKMETLLAEAIFLIKSLETDRAEAEEALKKQQSRRERINNTIDAWSIWRLEEIPLAVQKEHEVFLRDIVDLRWHLEDKMCQLQYLEEQKARLEEANAKLQADIDYMIACSPQLNSKLNHELKALKEYDKKNNEAMELYKHVHEELKEAIANCENAKLKAKHIREEMEKAIKNSESNVEAYKKQVEKLNVLCGHFSTLIQDINISIEKTIEAGKQIKMETRTTKDELSDLSKTLHDLKSIYDQLTWKKKSYENEYLERLKNFYDAKRSRDIELSNITKDFSDLSITYSQLVEENKRMEVDSEIIADSINKSVKAKSELETEIQSLMQIKSKNETYLKTLYKDAYHVGAVFHITRFKTEELEGQIAEVRRKFKGREDFLKRLTRGTVANGMMTQRRLYSIHEVLVFEKEEFMKKKALYLLTLAELEEPLLQMEEESERLKNLHTEQSELLNNIIEKRKHIKTHVEKTKEKLQKKEKKTQEALTESEKKHSVIFSEVERTKSKTVVYQEKINKLDKDLEEKEKEKRNIDQILETLREQLATIRSKKEHAQAIYDHLISEKKACEVRISEEEQRYRILVTKRQNTLADIKKLQDDSLEENLLLAQEYQKLQMIFLTEKDNYFKLYARQLSLDSSVRDKKQLCQLQRRIHKVWQKYLKLVVLYSQMKLAKFQTDSQESIQKILAVQEESSNLMQHIVDFFQTLSDGSCENDG
ncbi:coiled-coil domain-containing protein 178 [Molossus nigricans]